MPKMFFHLCDHSDYLLDQQGSNLDLADVPRRTLRAAREIIADDCLSGHVNMGYSIEVRDEGGKNIHTLFFKDAIEFVGLE